MPVAYSFLFSFLRVPQNCFAAFNFHPGFSFIVVSKRIHSRLFAEGTSTGRPVNPPPGTVCDDVITLPERCVCVCTSYHQILLDIVVSPNRPSKTLTN